jgi:hyperosmotically inducible periplasmic protein
MKIKPLAYSRERAEVCMTIESRRTRLFALLTLSGTLWIAAYTRAQAPDNSANNKQHDVTADQQSSAASDRAVTQKIRKALIADKSLSTYAHNVKIITVNGAVTLKGPVKSDEEKQEVASKAAEVVDATKVDNQLTVKAE